MDVVEMAAEIERGHASRLRAFRKDLFGERGHFVARPPGQVEPPRLRFPSMTDPHTVVSVIANISDMAEVTEDPGAGGVVVTVSVAALNRVLGTRARLADVEAIAVARAVLGPTWFENAYWSKNRSAVAGIRTPFFYVYLTPEGRAHPVPAGPGVPDDLQPVNPVSPPPGE